nr:uncharacterized protein LOC125420948 [Ziziphus jujuba var. spinosa]
MDYWGGYYLTTWEDLQWVVLLLSYGEKPEESVLVGAVDIGFSGTPYTWCNHQGGQANIRERLDRVIMSTEWRIIFNQAGILHLQPAGSDHIPIWLSLKQDHPYTPWPFRFLEAWTRDPMCEAIISQAWNIRNGNRTRIPLCA